LGVSFIYITKPTEREEKKCHVDIRIVKMKDDITTNLGANAMTYGDHDYSIFIGKYLERKP